MNTDVFTQPLNGIVAPISNDSLLDIEKSREQVINESCLTDEEKKTELLWYKFKYWGDLTYPRGLEQKHKAIVEKYGEDYKKTEKTNDVKETKSEQTEKDSKSFYIGMFWCVFILIVFLGANGAVIHYFDAWKAFGAVVGVNVLLLLLVVVCFVLYLVFEDKFKKKKW